MSKDAETYYNNEVRAFRQLKMFNGSNTNIIGFYGSYIHGDTFNVILEFADRGSLARYLKETTPPSSGGDIINFWSSLFEVIPALISIHDVEPEESGGPGIFQGYVGSNLTHINAHVNRRWHQDIKPQNLLVKSDNTKSSYEWPIKLADLGISHFSRKLASHRDGTARDAHGGRTYG
jgi:serine/threonine protein kinase